MKYMGSKSAMLRNGLGELILDEGRKKDRVVDLFCGGASVSWFAAQKLPIPVHAIDLQHYAVILARAVIGRSRELEPDQAGREWLSTTQEARRHCQNWKAALKLEKRGLNTAAWSSQARMLCQKVFATDSIVWRAYGGHYFSPGQAATLDCMLECLPKKEPLRSACLASIIFAASRCAASPGHTAQPFKATRTAGKFLREAWLRDPIKYAQKGIEEIFPRYASREGTAIVADALHEATRLSSNDLVFVDPPYSGVHYSRFYHVLETIARGRCGIVEGIGRYPPSIERPSSSFSKKAASLAALEQLIETLADVACTTILTFPNGVCSNGLSGRKVEAIAGKWFSITKKTVKTRFSTLGGNNSHRVARHLSKEMILLLKPKKASKKRPSR